MRKIVIVFVALFSLLVVLFYFKSKKINKGFENLELMYGKMSFMNYQCDCLLDSSHLSLNYQTLINYYEFDSLDTYIFKLQISDPFNSDSTFKVFKVKMNDDTLLLFVSAGFDGNFNFNGREFILLEDINNKNFYNSLNYYKTNEDFTFDKKTFFYQSLFGKKDYIIGLINCKKYIIVR